MDQEGTTGLVEKPSWLLESSRYLRSLQLLLNNWPMDLLLLLVDGHDVPSTIARKDTAFKRRRRPLVGSYYRRQTKGEVRVSPLIIYLLTH